MKHKFDSKITCAVLVLFLICIFLSFVLDIRILINFAHDDSFYYIKTANNFSKGFGSTFDKVNITNGYHPLWFLILSGYFFLLNLIQQFSPEIIFRFVFALHIAFSLITYFLLKRIFEILQTPKISLIIVSFLLIPFILIRDLGMETILSCVLFLLLVYFKSKELFYHKFFFIPKLVIYVLMSLTRTDYCFSVIPFFIISDIYFSDYQNKFKYAIKIYGACLLIYFTNMIINYFNFGNPNIVSSQIVSGFPSISLLDNIQLLFTPTQRFSQLPKILILWISTVIIYFNRNKFDNFGLFLFGSLIGANIYILIHLFFNSFGIREWYLALPIIISLILITYMLKEISKGHLVFLATIAFLFALSITYLTRVQNLKYNSIYAYSKLISKIVPENERIFSFDWMGVIGFFSDRNLICGDGFINSFEYLGYLRSGDITNYLKKYKIKYYSTYKTNPIDSFQDYKKFIDFALKPIIFDNNDIIKKFPYYYGHSSQTVSGTFFLVKFPFKYF